MLWQPSLPEKYIQASPEELSVAISRRRKELGDSLIILGHHYQMDEVLRHADFTGDSLKLSQLAAKVTDERPVRYVIFCGVHFMAESADMLTPDDVAVILPDLSAGCSMADMASYDDTVEAWETIHESLAVQGWSGRIIPITYVNSTAAIKAFVGEHGGACCTSSNADMVFEWAMNGGDGSAQDDIKILFLPDQHLGRNTAAKSGLDVASQTCVYDPKLAAKGEDLGGATAQQLRDSKVILWAGHCSVHMLFRSEHCDELRAADAAQPEQEPTQIIVHPECTKQVVDKADFAGSTEFIIKTLREAEPGSRWAVGTEVHLVNRMAQEMVARGVEVKILSQCQCLCTTMYRIDQPHLLWVLDSLCGQGTKSGTPQVVNQVKVHPEAREKALLALDRMLRLTSELVMVD